MVRRYGGGMISASVFSDHDAVRHGFFTRRGGVSDGIYESLNCGLGSDDDPECVQENRARAMGRLGRREGDLATAYQVHSASVARVDRPWPAADRPQVDGLVSNRPGVVLGILTADCAPVLFADADAGVIGAAHAGWRGARYGVLDATVAAMAELGAKRERIRAAIGPCIHQPSYEVGPEFVEAFADDEHFDPELFVTSDRPGHHRFDLPGYVARCLAGLAIAAVEPSPADTCADPDRFFSYRRTTLNGGGDYGRLLAAIALDT